MTRNIERPDSWFEPEPERVNICESCGHIAEYYGDTSGYKCKDCALGEWDMLTDDEKLKLLGFEPA